LTDRLLLQFDGLPGPIALVRCPELRDLLSTLSPGWTGRVCKKSDHDQHPLITVRRDEDGYWLTSRRNPKRARHKAAVDVTCALIAELFWPFLEAEPDLLCVHGAAAEFAGKLVVFPNRYRAGKSLLSAALAAHGHRLFTDDVLPIDIGTERGLALGVRPRLRIPVPDDLDARTRQFIDERAGPSSERYLYLNTREAEQAARGTQLPIGAFVLLERNASVDPAMTRISFGAVMQQLIWQNFARQLHHAEILRRLHQLSEGARCFRLSYARVEQAVTLLDESFDSWPDATAQRTATQAATVSFAGCLKTAGTPPRFFARDPRIVESTADGEHFLSNSDGTAIYHLNPLGSVVWRLLIDDISTAELVDAVHYAYPDVRWEQIEADVRELIVKLVESGLVVAGPESSPSGQ